MGLGSYQLHPKNQIVEDITPEKNKGNEDIIYTFKLE